MRRVGQHARLDDDLTDADPDRAERLAEVALPTRDVAVPCLAALAVGERDDRSRAARLGLRQFQWTARGLAGERIGRRPAAASAA